jgi:antitoxin (DNA-binding transcriptional repressor) of toxin-antitoxin stability system
MSVTEASRNFSDCINRVRYQGVSFILHKNGIAVARIVPEEATPKRDREAGAQPTIPPPEEKPAGKSRKTKPAPEAPAPEIW